MTVLMSEGLTGRGESVAPGNEGDIRGIREEVVIGGRIDIVELAPEDGFLAVAAHGIEHAVEEGYHEVGGLGVAMGLHHGATVVALGPIGRHGGFVASEVDVGRGEQGGNLADDIAQDAVALLIGCTHHAAGGGAYHDGVGGEMRTGKLGIGREDGYGVSGDVDLGHHLDMALGGIGDDAA